MDERFHEKNDMLVDMISIGVKSAEEELINNNSNMLHKICGRYAPAVKNSSVMDYNDLYQIASIGLLRAAKLFPEHADKYNHFYLYAYPYVTRYVRDSLDGANAIKVPRTAHRENPETENISCVSISSLGTPYDSKAEYSAEVVQTQMSPEEICIQKEEAAMLHRAIMKLDGREQYIIRYRYGIMEAEPCALRTLGNRLGISSQRVAVIQGHAEKKLKAIMSDMMAV